MGDIKTERLHFLDGLRGWGALAVVLFHVFVEAFPVTPESGTVLHRIALFNGTFAVWIFFVVSGFSLSIAFVRNGSQDMLLAQAYARYFRLIVPILAFSLIVYAVLKLGCFPSEQMRPEAIRKSPFFHFEPSIFETIRFALFDVFFDYKRETTLIPPLWTMPIELIGSFIVFLVCGLAGRHPSRWLVYLVALSAPIIMGGKAVYFGAFVYGLIMAEAFHAASPRTRSHWIAPAFVVIALVGAAFLPGKNLYWHLVVSGMLFSAIAFWPSARAAFETPISRFLGRISFPLYLIHSLVMWAVALPLLVHFDALEVRPHVRFSIDAFTVAISVMLATLLAFIDSWGVKISRFISAKIMAFKI